MGTKKILGILLVHPRFWLHGLDLPSNATASHKSFQDSRENFPAFLLTFW